MVSVIKIVYAIKTVVPKTIKMADIRAQVHLAFHLTVFLLSNML